MLVGYRRDIFKVLVLVPLAIISIYLALNGAGIISLSYVTRLGVHSILAYWAAIPAVVMIIQSTKKRTLSQYFFVAAFLFYIIAQIDHALAFLLSSQGVISIGPSNLIMTLVEICLTGILLFLGFLTHGRVNHIERMTHSWIIIPSIVVFPVFLYSLAFYLVRISVVLPYGGTFLTASVSLTIILFILQPLLCWRKCQEYPLDRGYLTGGAMLISIASIIYLTAVLTGSDIWIYAENLVIASLFLYGISFGMPYLSNLSYTRITRYLMVISLALTAYIPLLISTII